MDTRFEKAKEYLEKFISSMDRQLIALIKKEYPALSDIDNLYISVMFSRIRNNPNARLCAVRTGRIENIFALGFNCPACLATP